MARTTAPAERIFYDGGCGVCHWAVRFLARHDRSGRAFTFAPLGGETFRRSVPAEERAALPDSLVVATGDGRLLLRSAGVIHVLCRLGPGWRLLGALLQAVPRPLRDSLYDRFAASRHRFARRPDESCPLVPPELRRRFEP